jgi:hypothetical protein
LPAIKRRAINAVIKLTARQFTPHRTHPTGST